MRNTVAGGLVGLGYFSAIVFGLWALILDAGILLAVGGLPLLVVGFLLFPVAMTIAPFYAGFALGNWQPLQVTVAGTLMMWIFMGIGAAMMKKGRP